MTRHTHDSEETAPETLPAMTDDERIANLTRHVMAEINACSPGARLAEVPTLFAFGPIERAIRLAEARGREAATRIREAQEPPACKFCAEGFSVSRDRQWHVVYGSRFKCENAEETRPA